MAGPLVYEANLAESQSCRYFAFPKVKVVSGCSVSPLGSLELSSQIRRKAVLGLRSSLGRKTLPRIQKV